MVATSRAHLIAITKIPFHRHPYCVSFHFPPRSSSWTILAEGNRLGSTESTQLQKQYYIHMSGIFCQLILIMVAKSRAHLNTTTPKIPFQFSIDICIAFFLTSHSSLMTVLIR